MLHEGVHLHHKTQPGVGFHFHSIDLQKVRMRTFFIHKGGTLQRTFITQRRNLTTKQHKGGTLQRGRRRRSGRFAECEDGGQMWLWLRVSADPPPAVR